MKSAHKLLLIIFLVLIVFSNCKTKTDEEPLDESIIGKITVDLNANKNIIRNQETPLGNMVCDAYMEYAISKGIVPDFAVANSGAIRYNETNRTSGIYPAGDFSIAIIEEIFPWFDGYLGTVKVTGQQLKSAFERSVSSLPAGGKGWFLQVSKELKVTIDLSKQVQIINSVDANNPSIVTEGERITSIKVNGVEIEPQKTYTLLSTTYVCDGASTDYIIAFRNIDNSLKQRIPEGACADCGRNREALTAYIKKHSPVTPIVEGRIVFQ